MKPRPDIDKPYSLGEEQIRSFRKDGFIKIKNVLSPEVLAHYGKEIRLKVKELNQLDLPMEEPTTYQEN